MGETALRWDSSARTAGGDLDIAAVGALVADPARCRILLTLADGRELPASRLAADAMVSAATASSHLGKLADGGLVVAEARGRFRYYRLAGPAVAELIETLERLAPAAPVRSLRQSQRSKALREARTCYDHLAGRLGVELMQAMIVNGYLAGDDDGETHSAAGDIDYRLTERGSAFVDALDVRLPMRRPQIRYHTDTTEQRPHLAGGLGHGLLDRFIELRWIRSLEDSRAVSITKAGRQGLDEHFGLQLAGRPT